jgi:septal ring factor EnvC (AmiA/AmiB activator)
MNTKKTKKTENKFVTECPKCSHEYVHDDIIGGRCLSCGTMITDVLARAASTIRARDQRDGQRQMHRKLLKEISAQVKEKKKLQARLKKLETAINYIYDIIYFDSDEMMYDPDKEFDSAVDFMDTVHDLVVDIIPEPTEKCKQRPPWK